ncbi:EF-hand calcium-binding domain-containing protein 11-like isoform X10 [Balaenoptera acutorostrata]|uniref:EF-hand calcium-binding domain-containing protein 11-like isoform X10 n=1 Tax=Balaenoptera acutorostrata TaxID=9767 RepID=A0ABM3TB32_BALAC|nr:EF-hand calcium-binding domain-containing protein 11-like isoform X23 [Balaenoptera acutorostrata]XP_057399306.1 EF-hand calcium-binding domain-containing protein 11-like isoform X10 [Balaenoptera acutorostrata]
MFFSQAGARPRMWEASPSEHKKWVEVFKACDEENKGCLSRENFKVAVVMLFGYKPSKIEADAVMSSVDPNTSDRGYLTLEDFKKAFKQVAPKLSERIILEVFSRLLSKLLKSKGVQAKRRQSARGQYYLGDSRTSRPLKYSSILVYTL